MKIFNVGPLELLLILILAFLVLGPKRTITTARNFGRWIKDLIKSPFWRDILATSNEIRDLPRKIMDDAELTKMIEELDLSSKEIKEIITQAHAETEAELQIIEGQINQELKSSQAALNHTIED